MTMMYFRRRRRPISPALTGAVIAIALAVGAISLAAGLSALALPF